MENIDISFEAELALNRLWPRVELILPEPEVRGEFRARSELHFPRAFELLYALYGHRYDFFYHLEQIMSATANAYVKRATDLKSLDRVRESDVTWFQHERMMGGVCYVDLFANNLRGIKDRIGYFEELGLTYLHLMPLFLSPKDKNDGGFAISSYRHVNPTLGTTEELRELARDLRRRGISLVLDFVFNHTSDEHDWARRALNGESEYQDFYYMFEDRSLPDQYERHLREIFPEQAPGNFTYLPGIGKWVWTTFHQYQWDLNYRNPSVFTAMLKELMFIANLGAEIVRLDAVAFICKQLGTTCEGLPQAHLIVQAFNALVKIAAPAVLFKSEAIVHPDEVAAYIGRNEAPISYNPTLMALLWESLATRQVKLLHRSMSHYFLLPEGCSWVNYIRCHDDIGWTFADEDAAALGINAFDHRQFLNRFYTGAFEGSFARGLPFNYNPVNQDMRISGMAASLAGLEEALELGNDLYTEHAMRRVELIHAVILSVGGIPLLYLGDEIGMLNDYTYRQDPDRSDDSRFVHRLKFDWERAALRTDPESVPGRLFQKLKHLITIRRETPLFANGNTSFFDTQNEHVLGYSRNDALFVLANFSERPQTVHVTSISTAASPLRRSTGGLLDLVSGVALGDSSTLALEAYQYVWLVEREE